MDAQAASPVNSGTSNPSANVAGGRIVVDTSQLDAAARNVAQSSRAMQQSMQQISSSTTSSMRQITVSTNAASASTAMAARNMVSSWKTVSVGIGLAIGQLSTLSGLLAVVGVAGAQHIKRVNATFEILAGSQERANELTDQLRRLADETGQPFLDLKESAVSFLPAIKGTNVELSKTVLLAQRLLMKDPTARVKDAVIALNEFLSGEYISLARRFEIPREAVQQILQDSGGDTSKAIQGLSDYLDALGLTEDALRTLGAEGVFTFSALRSEATETMAVAFTPFLNEVMLPLVRAFGDFFRELRKVNPELQRTVGIAMGLAGLPALMGRIPGVSQMLGSTGSKALTYAGVGAASLYVGTQAGAAITTKAGIGEHKGLSQEEALNKSGDRLKQFAVIAVDKIGEIVKALNFVGLVFESGGEMFAAVIKTGAALVGYALAELTDVIGAFVRALGGMLQQLDKVDLGVFGTLDLGTAGAAASFGKAADDIERFADSMRTSPEEMMEWADRLKEGMFNKEFGEDFDRFNKKVDDFVIGFAESIGVIEEKTPIIVSAMQKIGSAFQALAAQAPTERGPLFNQEQIDAFAKFQDDLQQIEADKQEQREEQLKQHEQDKLEAEQDYQRSLSLMLEDEKLRQQQAAKDLAERIAGIRQDLAENEAEGASEYHERLADLAEQYQESQAKRLQAHQRDMERMQAQHRDNLLSAASRLDARAVYEEQRSYDRARKDKQEAFDEEAKEQQKQYEKTLTQEREAYEARLQENRENAEKQIRELQEQHAKEEAERAADFQRRLTRMSEEHAQQMARMDQQNADRLAQIDAQAAKEAAARETAFANEFNELSTHEANKLNIQREYQALTEKELREWWERQRGIFNNNAGGASGPTLPTRQVGGPIYRRGAHDLEPGEYVIRRDTAALLRRMYGGEITPARLMGAGASGGDHRRTIIMKGDIIVQEAKTPHDTAQVVRAEFGKMLAEIGMPA
jgi:hypothetical protein